MLEVCPTCTDTSAQTAAPLADQGINDRLVELRPLVDETRFEFIDVSNFGVINFLLQNTPDAVVEFGDHSVGGMKSGVCCSRKVMVSRAGCAAAPSC